jgi:hypothetical protein
MLVMANNLPAVLRMLWCWAWFLMQKLAQDISTVSYVKRDFILRDRETPIQAPSVRGKALVKPLPSMLKRTNEFFTSSSRLPNRRGVSLLLYIVRLLHVECSSPWRLPWES